MSKILGKRFSKLVKTKKTYIATPELIKLATDADQGENLQS